MEKRQPPDRDLGRPSADKPEGAARASVGCALGGVGAVVTPVMWVVINGVVAIVVGRAPSGRTSLVLGFIGVPVGALAGLLLVKLGWRKPPLEKQALLIAVVLAVVGLALALSSVHWAGV